MRLQRQRHLIQPQLLKSCRYRTPPGNAAQLLSATNGSPAESSISSMSHTGGWMLPPGEPSSRWRTLPPAAIAHEKKGARLGDFSEVKTTKTHPPLPRTASAHAAPLRGAHRLPPSASAKVARLRPVRSSPRPAATAPAASRLAGSRRLGLCLPGRGAAECPDRPSLAGAGRKVAPLPGAPGRGPRSPPPALVRCLPGREPLRLGSPLSGVQRARQSCRPRASVVRRALALGIAPALAAQKEASPYSGLLDWASFPCQLLGIILNLQMC